MEDHRFRAEIVALKGKLDVLVAGIDAFKSQRDAARAIVHALRPGSDALIAQFNESRTQARRIFGFRPRMIFLDEAIDDLQAIVDDCQAIVDDCQASYDNMRAAIDDARAEIDGGQLIRDFTQARFERVAVVLNVIQDGIGRILDLNDQILTANDAMREVTEEFLALIQRRVTHENFGLLSEIFFPQYQLNVVQAECNAIGAENSFIRSENYVIQARYAFRFQLLALRAEIAHRRLPESKKPPKRTTS